VVLYALRDYLDESVVNRALHRLVLEKGSPEAGYAVSSDFLDILKQEAGPAKISMIEDFLQRITLYDLKLNNSKIERMDDGRYRIILTVTAGKLYADSSGLETPAAFGMPVDIGFFSRSPRVHDFSTSEDVILMEKHWVPDGTSSLEIIVDRLPLFAGIDPYNKLIDKNADDNIRSLTPP
jgi:hypothetical protein